ncbi:MAG: hypothetical protein AAGU18_10980 [Proteiniphilum sp.]
MEKFIAEKLMELAVLERDLQLLYIKIKNPGNMTPGFDDFNLKGILDHVELSSIQISELKEEIIARDSIINAQQKQILELTGDLSERDCQIHSMQIELDDSKIKTVPQKKTGAYLIAEERERQIEALGCTPEYDQSYTKSELAKAAACYAIPEALRNRPGRKRIEKNGQYVPNDWPFSTEYWKPSPDNRIRELQKAGALIAADIDRLQYSEKDSLLYTKENNHE